MPTLFERFARRWRPAPRPESVDGRPALYAGDRQAGDIWGRRGAANGETLKRTRASLDAALGYIDRLTYADYAAEYARNALAAAVINRPVLDCWIAWPTVYETKEGDTAFELAWEAMQQRLMVWSRLARVDRLASVGEYAVLVVGTTNGGKNMSQPPGRGGDLAYLGIYDQAHARIVDTDADPESPRYGMPTSYGITTTNYVGGKPQTQEQIVHWGRVIHIVEGALSSDLFGVPRLRVIYNRLMSSEMLSGGAAEMFFRGAFPGLVLRATGDTRLSVDEVKAIRDHMSTYTTNLDRVVLLEGLDLVALSPQVSSPAEHDDVITRHIAAAADIPQRILLGSERGQLASDQDERAWANTIAARRLQYIEPMLIRPLIDRLIDLAVLPRPTVGYNVSWVPYAQMSPTEQAEVGLRHANALATYVSAPGIEDLMPPDMFLRREIGLSDADVALALKATEDAQAQEQETQEGA